MAFIGAGKSTLYVGGYDLSTYFRSAQLSMASDVAETSAFRTTSKAYIPGMKYATLSAEGMFDGTTTPAPALDKVLSDILGSETKQQFSYGIGTEALGTVSYGMEGTDSTHEVDTATDDVGTVNMEVTSDTCGERCLVHHALGAETGSGNGTSIDNAASSASGGVGYLHVTAQSGGGTLTVKVQHSVDNSVWADLITFTGVTAIGSQRVAVAGTVNRYTRDNHAITAGSATYMMAFGRKTYS